MQSIDKFCSVLLHNNIHSWRETLTLTSAHKGLDHCVSCMTGGMAVLVAALEQDRV